MCPIIGVDVGAGTANATTCARALQAIGEIGAVGQVSHTFHALVVFLAIKPSDFY